MNAPRLMIINNMPAFYRTPLFSAICDEWSKSTGGKAVVGYQVRRATHTRAEWFFSDEADMSYPHFYVSPDTIMATNRTGYPTRSSIRRFLALRPTHLFVAGWDSPLSAQAAAWARLTGARMAAWVESNPTTSLHPGGLGDVYRRAFLRATKLVVVPTRSSMDHVNRLAGREIESLRLPNPVTCERIPDSPVRDRRIIFLGDFSHRKGFDIFQRAAEALHNDGWAAVAWGRDVENLAARSSAVDARPSQPLADIIPHLHANDVLVIPSRWDPAPLTYSEGLALGLRVLLSESVAYAEGMGDETGTAVVPAEDAGAIARMAKIVEVQDRPSRKRSQEVRPEWFAKRLVGALAKNEAR